MKRQFTDVAGVVHQVAALGESTWLRSQAQEEETLHGGIRRSADGTLLITQDGITRPVHLSRSGDDVWLSSAAGTTRWRRYEQRRGVTVETGDCVISPMTGKVVVVSVAVGDAVSKGDVLVVVEAMKMEQPLIAPRDGVVEKVACEAGQLVDGGVELVTLVPLEAS